MSTTLLNVVVCWFSVVFVVVLCEHSIRFAFAQGASKCFPSHGIQSIHYKLHTNTLTKRVVTTGMSQQVRYFHSEWGAFTPSFRCPIIHTSHCDPYPGNSKCQFSYIMGNERMFIWTLPDPSRVRTCKLDTYGIYINDLWKNVFSFFYDKYWTEKMFSRKIRKILLYTQ